jgi:replicative DNA helicase
MSSVLRNELAEQALIASIFNTPEVLSSVSEIITPQDFFEPRNEIIYSSILSLYEHGQDFSPVSVVGHLTREGLLAKAGDIGYFRDIINPNDIINVGADPVGFALLVKEASRKRELSQAADVIKEAAESSAGMDANDALEVANNTIIDILNKEAASENMVSVLDLLPEVLDDIRSASDLPEGATPGIPTGFQMIDEMTGGFKGGQVIIIAARPAVGKSTLAVDFGRAAAYLAGKTVLMFSLEMGSKELITRILSAEAGVKTQDLKTGQLSDIDWMNVEEASKRFKNGTFLIDATPKTSVSRIRSIASRQKLKSEGLDMIIIDYLQLLESSGNFNRNTTREQVVSEMSRGLKLLAKELDVPVIVLSQLNRKSEERQDTRPMVSDLRESGSLEQDADMIFLIHRPEVTDPNNRPGEADLILGKHRGGPTGRIPLTSMLEYSKFVPGEGQIPREMELVGDGNGGEFAVTEDETPW